MDVDKPLAQTVLGALCAAGQWAEVECLVKLLHERGLVLPLDCFLHALNAMTSSGAWTAASRSLKVTGGMSHCNRKSEKS